MSSSQSAVNFSDFWCHLDGFTGGLVRVDIQRKPHVLDSTFGGAMLHGDGVYTEQRRAAHKHLHQPINWNGTLMLFSVSCQWKSFAPFVFFHSTNSTTTNLPTALILALIQINSIQLHLSSTIHNKVASRHITDITNRAN